MGARVRVLEQAQLEVNLDFVIGGFLTFLLTIEDGFVIFLRIRFLMNRGSRKPQTEEHPLNCSVPCLPHRREILEH